MAEFGVRQRWVSCVPGFDRIYLLVTDGLLGESDEVFVVGVHVCQFAVDEHDNLIFAPLLLLTNVSRDDTLRLLSQTGVPIHLGEGNTQRVESLAKWYGTLFIWAPKYHSVPSEVFGNVPKLCLKTFTQKKLSKLLAHNFMPKL